MKNNFISIMTICILIFGANAAKAMEDDVNSCHNGYHTKVKSSFEWNKYKEMDELELDELFQEEFNKKNFTEAAWFLMRSVKNGNEEHRIYLSRVSKSENVMVYIEKENIPGMENIIPTISKFLEERAKERAQQQTQKVILPRSEEYSFWKF